MTGRPRVDPATRERRSRFGDAVRDRRKLLGLSQPALAERAGCDRQSISRVENGWFSPTLDRAWRLAATLGVPLAELVAEPGDTP